MNDKHFAWFCAWAISAGLLTCPTMGWGNLAAVIVALILLHRFWAHPRWHRKPPPELAQPLRKRK